VALSPDSDLAVTGSADDSVPVQLWDLSVADDVRQICRGAQPPTRPEWSQYVPGLDYAPPCSAMQPRRLL
jgi:hypothetical protein